MSHFCKKMQWYLSNCSVSVRLLSSIFTPYVAFVPRVSCWFWYIRVSSVVRFSSGLQMLTPINSSKSKPYRCARVYLLESGRSFLMCSTTIGHIRLFLLLYSMLYVTADVADFDLFMTHVTVLVSLGFNTIPLVNCYFSYLRWHWYKRCCPRFHCVFLSGRLTMYFSNLSGH